MVKSIYITNELNEDTYICILVSPNLKWSVDKIMDMSTTTNIRQKIYELNKGANIIKNYEKVDELQTVEELCKILRNSARIVKPEEAKQDNANLVAAAQDVLHYFQGTAKKIEYRVDKNVCSEAFIESLDTDTRREISNSESVYLIIVTLNTNDYINNKVATFSSRDYSSWITQKENVVHSRLDDHFDPDPGLGKHDWTPTAQPKPPKPPKTDHPKSQTFSTETVSYTTTQQWTHTTKSGYTFKWENGDLCHQDSSEKLLWHSETKDLGKYLLFDKDGDMSINDDYGVLWSSNTKGKNPAYLSVQEDGKVIIYNTSNKAIWDTNTKSYTTNHPRTILIKSEQTYYDKGSNWKSKSGYKLIFKEDGNICYYSPSEQCLWTSNTNQLIREAKYLSFKKSGKIILYDKDYEWTTECGTNNGNAAYISLQDNGFVTMYDTDDKEIWTTNPNKIIPASGELTFVLDHDYKWTTKSGYKLVFSCLEGKLRHHNPSGQCIWTSTNEKYGKETLGEPYLVISKDLTYIAATINEQIVYIWEVDTWKVDKSEAQYFLVQEDGDVAIYNKNDKLLWHTDTKGK